MGLLLIDAVFSSSLPRGERETAVVYARAADDAGGLNCFPGVEHVAAARGVKPPIIRLDRRKLIARGVVLADEVMRHGRKNVKPLAFDAWNLPDVDLKILVELEKAAKGKGVPARPSHVTARSRQATSLHDRGIAKPRHCTIAY